MSRFPGLTLLLRLLSESNRALGQQGKAVFYSHVLEVVERVCSIY
jgi:hypothetical protein